MNEILGSLPTLGSVAAPSAAIDADRYSINCTGDACVGDEVMFTEAVFGGGFQSATYLGERRITARIIRDSYGAAKQQHSFTLLVLASDGLYAPEVGSRIIRKGRNLYRNGLKRAEWDCPAGRGAALDEKHRRGDAARSARYDRRGF